eukprot:TRINITY_DN14414_c0_g1_i1.p1 TRINITY_DN14414_c0_g1~~TRINITY_DN14414_c0_g1_i1.p1  ORF type:complete len:500 (+),score=204.95 TRINITY_DN14414_c0_g1_i1:43-1500(+)
MLELVDPYARAAPTPPSTGTSRFGQRLKFEIGGGRSLADAPPRKGSRPEELQRAIDDVVSLKDRLGVRGGLGDLRSALEKTGRAEEKEARVRELEAELESTRALSKSQEGHIAELLHGKDALLLEVIGEKRARLLEAERSIRSPQSKRGESSVARPRRARSPRLGSMLKPLPAAGSTAHGTPLSALRQARTPRGALAEKERDLDTSRRSASASVSALPQTAAAAEKIQLQKKLADAQQKALLLEAQVKELAQGKDDVLRDMIEEKQARVRDREEILRLRDLLEEKQSIKAGRVRVGLPEAAERSGGRDAGDAAHDAATIRRLQDEVVDLRRSKSELMEELIQEKKLRTRDREEMMRQLRGAEGTLDAARRPTAAPLADEAIATLKTENRDLREQLQKVQKDLAAVSKAQDATLLDVIAEKQARIADAEQLMLVREQLEDCRKELVAAEAHKDRAVRDAETKHQKADMHALRRDVEDELAKLTAYA